MKKQKLLVEELVEPKLEYATVPDADLEARQDQAEALKLEALDGIKDAEREAQIDKLEAGNDLLHEVNQDNSQRAVRSDRDDRREKYTPAKVEKSWYIKTERAQRRILQKKLGSYLPERDDPVPTKPHPKAVAEGSLFDPHPLSRVRKRDVEATGAIKAAIQAPVPVKPPPVPAPPEEGRCWECYLPIRKSGKNKLRAGTKFCTDEKDKCRKAYNSREADRDALNQIFKDWTDSQHDERMLSVHRVAANAMMYSADRCGINATFTATADGVLAVHVEPLPPIEKQVWVHVEVGDSVNRHPVQIVATDDDAGTLFTIEISPPEGYAVRAELNFEGDPGWSPEVKKPVPRMSAMFAARNGIVAQYLAALKRAA